MRYMKWLCFLGVLSVWLVGVDPALASEKKLLPAVEPNEEGLYHQPWFHESFLDLREDAAEAAADGRQLVILWEQRGCPYCREMHNVNLRIPETVDYIKKHFVVVSLNLWGDREVTDVDGQVTTEKKLARKYRVQFTPTMQFFPKKIAAANKKPGHDVEVWRLMGYWKPFHFQHTFVYVHEGGFDKQPNFQRWLQTRAREYEAQGKKVELW
jgi:thioredoxin-related protein